MLKFKKYWWIIFLGIILRVVIASITYHPDVRIMNFTSFVILEEGNLDPYGYQDFQEVPDDLPLQYWIHLPVDFFTRLFIDERVEKQFLSDTTSLLGNSQLWQHLLIIKLPLILFDIILGLLITFLFPLNLRKKAMLFWFFNPFTLWATVAVGQTDIIPTLFVVLSLVFLQRGKMELSALSLGLGGALKSFPFLIAPFLILLPDKWSQKIKLTAILSLPFLITVLPYLPSIGFRTNALFAPQLDKILYAKVYLSGGEAIYIVVTLLIFLYLYYIHKQKTFENFINFSTSALLMILSFTHFHIQWFLWVTPFLIYYLVKGVSKVQIFSIALMIVSVVGMLLLYEQSLQVGLFSPLFPELTSSIGLAESLNGQNLEMLKNICATIFASSAIFFAHTIIPWKEQ